MSSFFNNLIIFFLSLQRSRFNVKTKRLFSYALSLKENIIIIINKKCDSYNNMENKYQYNMLEDREFSHKLIE